MKNKQTKMNVCSMKKTKKKIQVSSDPQGRRRIIERKMIELNGKILNLRPKRFINYIRFFIV